MYQGWLYLNDSLILIHSFMNPNHFIPTFDIITGENKGEFLVRGNGPNEFQNLSKIYQVYEDNDGDKIAVLHLIMQDKIVLWNITQSISSNSTILEEIISLKNVKIEIGWFRNGVYRMNQNTFLTGTPMYYTASDSKDYKLQKYQKINVKTSEVEQEYLLLKRPIINNSKNFYFPGNDFYTSSTLMHPLGKQLFTAMISMAQVNIIDLETGEQKAFG